MISENVPLTRLLQQKRKTSKGVYIFLGDAREVGHRPHLPLEFAALPPERGTQAGMNKNIY